MLKDFSLKFIDIMIGVVLGVGFQWWADLKEPWQYLAFTFVYLNLIYYWIDYSPTLKKYPFKREFDVILHAFIVFSMFYLIFSTRQSIHEFFLAYAVYRIADIVWIWRMKHQSHQSSKDIIFLHTWMIQDFIEVLFCITLLLFTSIQTSLSLIVLFIILRLATRIGSSLRYKTVFYE